MTSEELYLINFGNELVGFASYNHFKYIGHKISYLHGIVVDPSFQKNGIFKSVNERVIENNKTDFLAMRTQSPVIYHALKNISRKIYPGYDRSTDFVKNLGEYIARNKLNMGEYDRDSFVTKNAYGKSLYDSLPVYGDDENFLRDELKLDFSKGDSVLLISETKNYESSSDMMRK
ncbi:GNAT family N-acetyltransferase [Candidatus Woesearchaeota archaeon]|nr:GNAT family N-acetyltransferase [Candidatus Woesearchaeota archaeon]